MIDMDKKYEIILFDFDGTIADSKPGILKCIRRALDIKGVPYTEAILDKMVGPPFRVSMKEFCGVEGDVVEELIALYRADYEIDGWRECSLYDGVVELFQTLQNAGKRLGIATSKPIKFTQMIVEDLNLSKFFEFVGGAESDSSRDTKADVIDHVIKNMNVTDKSKVLMVGDRLYDIVGAKTCGIDSMGILWGYGDREEFETYGADYILEMPKDVAHFLLK